MSLINDATITLERLTKLKVATDGAEEARSLSSLRNELAELASPINTLVEKASVLRGERVTLTPIPELANIRGSIQKNLECFQETPKASTLRQGTRWTTLTNKLKTFALLAHETLTNDWYQYFDQNFFGGLSPAKREENLAKTMQNESALKLYRQIYQEFIKYRRYQPTNTEEFNKIRLLSQQLANIAFEENVPDGVRKFFDALNEGGAELHLLTPDVLAWLCDKGSLANYIVRARNN